MKIKDLFKKNRNNKTIKSFKTIKDGNEIWWKYHEDGSSENHIIYPNGDERWTEFSADDKLVHYKNSNGYEYWYEKIEIGCTMHIKYQDGRERWITYDNNNDPIYIKESNGEEIWYEYSESGNTTHIKEANGIETWIKYNKDGEIIHWKDSTGNERCYM